MILVDTSVWINYFNGINNKQTAFLDFYLEQDLIITGDLILIELLQGFKSDKDYNIAKRLMNNFTCFDLIGKDIAIESINNYRTLRKKGITIRKTIDVIIASFCIYNKIFFLHNDKDFFPFEKYLDLRVIKR